MQERFRPSVADLPISAQQVLKLIASPGHVGSCDSATAGRTRTSNSTHQRHKSACGGSDRSRCYSRPKVGALIRAQQQISVHSGLASGQEAPSERYDTISQSNSGRSDWISQTSTVILKNSQEHQTAAAHAISATPEEKQVKTQAEHFTGAISENQSG
jgi:hypothetical protein